MRKYNLIGFAEIDKNAVKAYCQLHNVNNSHDYGDIQQINKSNVEQPVDMLVGGTPCQDFASLGLRTGCLYKCANCGYSYDPLTISIRNRNHCPRCGKLVDEKTRSSIMIEYLRLVRELKPKIIIWENVSAVATNKKFQITFNKFIEEIKKHGYTVRYYILNSRDYGVPQSRKRVILIAVDKIFDNGKLEIFPHGYRELTVTDILQNSSEITNNKLWLSDPADSDKGIISKIYSPTVQAKVQAVYDSIGYLPPIFGLRNRRDYGYIPCITTNSGSPSGDGTIVIKSNNRLRKISALECWLAMGFDETDYNSCNKIGLSDAALRKLAGNSIVVDMLVGVYRDLYNSQPHLFNSNMRVLSVCSGIGAFEQALDIFFEKFCISPALSPEKKYTYENCLLQYPDPIPSPDVCDVLQIHRNTLYKLINSGKLKSSIIGGKHYIHKASIIAYLNQQETFLAL